MKGNIIGKGYTAEVYEWGDKEVVKLFYKDFPKVIIEREFNISKTIKERGLPIPGVRRIIEFEGRSGIIYTKISGKALMEKIMKHPFRSKQYITQMTELQYQMHQCKSLDIPKLKESLEWNIRQTEYLSEKQKLSMLTLLGKLPEGDCLCHGDYHPGNIISDGTNTYILDWMTASSGVPAADVARTSLLLKDATLPEEIPGIIKAVIQFQRNNMTKKYIKEYLRLSGLKKEEIFCWRPVIAAARLMEKIPLVERRFLIDIVNKAMKHI